MAIWGSVERKLGCVRTTADAQASAARKKKESRHSRPTAGRLAGLARSLCALLTHALHFSTSQLPCMEPLPCVNRPIVHHLGLSRHRLWRAAKAQARRPRPAPARPSPSLALLLAAGLPLAWTERKYTCVQLRASISGYVHRALHHPRYTNLPPPEA